MSTVRGIRAASALELAQPAIGVAAQFADAVDQENRFPHEAIDMLKSTGLLSVAVRSDLGGQGASLSELCAITRTLGTACASTAMIFAMHQICFANLLDCAFGSAWHRALIQRTLHKPMLFASSTTEAGIGGDLRQSVCAPVYKGDGFTLIKEAPVISSGEWADAIFATARRDAGAASSDQILAVLLRDQYTLDRTSVWDTLGMRGTCSHGYRLKAKAKTEQIVPMPFADIAADSMVAISHILWSSVWSGIAAGALGRAQNHLAARARGQAKSGGPGPARLTEAFGRLRFVDAAIKSVAEEWELACKHPTLSAAAAVNALKVSVSNETLAIVDDALSLLGLEGYRNGGPSSVSRHLRDIHSARLMISNDRIADATGQMLLLQRARTAKAG